MQQVCRRSILAGLAAGCRDGPRASSRFVRRGSPGSFANKHYAAIEAREGGRLGVAILDTETGSRLEHRSDERFPMCSTFKLLARGRRRSSAWTRASNGSIARSPYGPSDLLDCAPIAKAHIADGGMTLGDLCAAAIDWSDNTALPT